MCSNFAQEKKKKRWFNPQWLLQLQTAFTKLNRIHNSPNASQCHSATAQLGKRVLKKLNKITDWGDHDGSGLMLPPSRNHPLPPPRGLLGSHSTNDSALTKEAQWLEVESLWGNIRISLPVCPLEPGGLKMAAKSVPKLKEYRWRSDGFGHLTKSCRYLWPFLEYRSHNCNYVLCNIMDSWNNLRWKQP